MLSFVIVLCKQMHIHHTQERCILHTYNVLRWMYLRTVMPTVIYHVGSNVSTYVVLLLIPLALHTLRVHCILLTQEYVPPEQALRLPIFFVRNS